MRAGNEGQSLVGYQDILASLEGKQVLGLPLVEIFNGDLFNPFVVVNQEYSLILPVDVEVGDGEGVGMPILSEGYPVLFLFDQLLCG